MTLLLLGLALVVPGTWWLAGRLPESGDLLPSGAPEPGVSAGRRPAVSSRADSPAPPPVPVSLLGRLPVRGAEPDLVDVGASPLATPGPRLAEWVPLPPDAAPGLEGPLRIEYAVDAELTRRIERVLRRARVRRGHAIVLDPHSGRVLAYVSTNPEAFPPEGAYPAASLIKVVTAAAALDRDPSWASRTCRYTGNPYRLRRRHVDPPRRGREISLGRALAMSNNHCFAQVAVHTVGADALLSAIGRFGLLEPPAPGHAAGSAEAGDDAYDLARLGSGLHGSRITPLHGAQLAATLADGVRVEPWWLHRVHDAAGRSLGLPRPPLERRVMTRELAEQLRGWLVRTTVRGTARSAFRDRRGRPRLGEIAVAGKTGNLTGSDPWGRYEWFAGLAPADDPSVAVAVVQLHDDLWWQNSASVAAGVLEQVFCEKHRCDPGLARRFTGDVSPLVAPVFLSDTRSADPSP